MPLTQLSGDQGSKVKKMRRPIPMFNQKKKSSSYSRVELKELIMTRARMASAEALVKHISERIQTDNKTVLDRTGVPPEKIRSNRTSPVLRSSSSGTPMFSQRSSPHGGTATTMSRQQTNSRTRRSPPAPQKSLFTGEVDPGEAGVVDPFPNESYEIVSAYLQQIVRDLMGQMTGPSSAQHYDRHVLLVDEMLRRDAIYGFTPSMILGGVGDIMCLLAEALLDGKFLLPPHPTQGCSKSKAHRAAIAAAATVAAAMGPSAAAHGDDDDGRRPSTLAVPKLGIESYLPSHIKKPVALDYHNVDGLGPEAGAGGKKSTSSYPMVFLESLNEGGGGEEVDSHHQIEGSRGGSPMRQRALDSKILTVQDALYAMVQHCSRPLICVTLEDQRQLVPAVEHLCSVLSRIASEVVSDGAEEYPILAEATIPAATVSETNPFSSGGVPDDNSGALLANNGGSGLSPDSTSSFPVADQPTRGPNLGGLTLEQHQAVTQAIRLSALHGIEAVLSVYDRHIDTIEMTKEREVAAGSAKGKGKVQGCERVHIDSVTTFILNNLDLNRTEISELLVERWAAILEDGPVTLDSSSIQQQQDGTEANTQGGGAGATGKEVSQAPFLDSARNVNAFNAEDAFGCNGTDSDDDDEEEEKTTPHEAKGRNANNTANTESALANFPSSGSFQENNLNSNARRGSSSGKPQRKTMTPSNLKVDDSRFRGVMTIQEEEEVAAILHIFIQLFSISEYAMGLSHAQSTVKTPMGSKKEAGEASMEVQLHPLVPVLISRTLARCAVGDYCCSLCMDLLWQLILSAPEMTSRAILYDQPQSFQKQQQQQNGSVINSLFDTSAAENLFQTLVNFLNTSHRQQQREMRNDIVIFLTSILSTNTKAMKNVPLNTGSVIESPLQTPIPTGTIDAMSAISLVMFDLLCRPELSAENFQSKSVVRSFPGEDSSVYSLNKNSSAVPCLSFVSQQTLLQYSIRFHGVSCTTLRNDNLQFKRVGWQFLNAFCEWQSTHMSYEGKVIDLIQYEQDRLRSLEPSRDREKESSTGGSTGAGSTVGDGAKHGATYNGNNNADGNGKSAHNGSSNSISLSNVEEVLECRRQSYECYHLVDLCHMGFLDVLLIYCNVHSQNSVVLSWTPEELYALQEESWRLTNALVRSAESNRERYGISSICQEDIEDVRSRLHSSPAGGNNNSVSNVSARLGPQAGNNPPSMKDWDCTQPGTSGSQQSRIPYYPADVYFVALDGVETALAYVTQAPASVERLKYLAIGLLASVSRSSDKAVQRSLAYASPVVVPLLTELLKNLLAQVTEGFGTTYKATAKGSASSKEVPCSTIPAPERLQTLVLSCFSLLRNIGAAAEQMSCGAGQALHYSEGTSHATPHSSPETPPPARRSSDYYNEKPPSTSSSSSTSDSARVGCSPELPCAAWHFHQSGGIQQLVAWTRYVLNPNPVKAESITISALSKAPSPSTTARPPIVEKDLYNNLDLILVLLSCVRVLVLHVPENQIALLTEDGMGALLSTIEVLAIASNALPSKYTEKVDCILRDRSIAVSLPSGFHNQTIEETRRAEFDDALKYALSVLSDYLLSCREALPYYFQWHSPYLPKAHEVGFGAPLHVCSHDNYLNATQLLLAMWIKATSPRTPDDPYYYNAEDPHNAQNLVIGLRVLNANLRPVSLVSLRREYVRRLLRRRVKDRMEAAQAATGESVEPEPLLSIEELVNYYHYIFETKTHTFSDREIAVRMMELVNTDQATARSIHERIITDAICQPLRVAIKVFSCLAAIGFDELIEVPISPQERAHLIGVAALPALCTDELCISMAEVAKVTESLPWGKKYEIDFSRSYADTPPPDKNEVVSMRPTTPDRRCLSTLMDDVKSRSHELSQLFVLGEVSETTQLRELYNRFLITRLKQPVGIASLWEEYNQRRGTCSACAFEQMDVLELQQQQQQDAAPRASPDMMSEYSSTALSQHQPRSNASSPLPSQLAISVAKKAEMEQEEDAYLACQKSYPGMVYQPNQGEKLRVVTPGMDEDAGGAPVEEIPIASTPSAMAHNIAVYNRLGEEDLVPVGQDGTLNVEALQSGPHHSGECGPQCPCRRPGNMDYDPALSPHRLLNTVMGRSGTDSRNLTVNINNPLSDQPERQKHNNPDSTVVSLQVTWPSRPRTSLAEKHLKKDRMIRNSLRAVGSVTKKKPSLVVPEPKQEELLSTDARRNVQAKEQAVDLVGKVFDYVDYAEPQPAHIFALEPEEDARTGVESDLDN